jgi:hypothetical protein
VAAVLSWTKSAGEAFDKAANSAEEDGTGEPALERVWSRLAKTALVEETELTTDTSKNYIVRNGADRQILCRNLRTSAPVILLAAAL